MTDPIKIVKRKSPAGAGLVGGVLSVGVCAISPLVSDPSNIPVVNTEGNFDSVPKAVAFPVFHPDGLQSRFASFLTFRAKRRTPAGSPILPRGGWRLQVDLFDSRLQDVLLVTALANESAVVDMEIRPHVEGMKRG